MIQWAKYSAASGFALPAWRSVESGFERRDPQPAELRGRLAVQHTFSPPNVERTSLRRG
jgi:hypothetical protein